MFYARKKNREVINISKTDTYKNLTKHRIKLGEHEREEDKEDLENHSSEENQRALDRTLS